MNKIKTDHHCWYDECNFFAYTQNLLVLHYHVDHDDIYKVIKK